MEPKVKEQIALIENALSKLNWKDNPQSLYDPIEYVLSLGGKRIRPALCTLACEFYSGETSKAIPAALGLEIFHNFTLLHDDIMDRADTRRGQPTVHKKWNDNAAILSGDAMLICAYQYMSQVESHLLSNIMTLFSKVALEVCKGQELDMSFERRDNVTIDEYIEMIRLKTAVLLGSVLKIGAIVAKADAKNQKAIYDFGINLGMAFQLQDDIFDCYGDVKVFGKMTGGDIADNKKTYLYLKALELASAEDKKVLLQLFSMPKGRDDKKIETVLNIYDKYNVRNIVTDLMTKYYEDSLKNLDEIDVPEERKQILRDYAAYLYTRNK